MTLAASEAAVVIQQIDQCNVTINRIETELKPTKGNRQELEHLGVRPASHPASPRGAGPAQNRSDPLESAGAPSANPGNLHPPGQASARAKRGKEAEASALGGPLGLRQGRGRWIAAARHVLEDGG